MTLLLFTDAACRGHDPGGGHPERPQRLDAILRGAGTLPGGAVERRTTRPATRAELERVHTPAHVARIFAAAPAAGSTSLDPDTHMSPGSLAAALAAAGAGIAAVDAVCAGPVRRAFCAVRPPGHHATRGAAMGFCLFNNVAVAAAHALAVHGLARVAIADFDVHHGNGSADIFRAEPRVLYLSSHQMPLYPGTGDPAENGASVVNAALPPESGSAAFRAAWSEQLLPRLEAFAPELLLVSAGFDADRRDPLAQLRLDAADYAWLTRELLAVATRHAGGRIVSTLEGGYALDALAEDGAAHLCALAGGADAER